MRHFYTKMVFVRFPITVTEDAYFFMLALIPQPQQQSDGPLVPVVAQGSNSAVRKNGTALELYRLHVPGHEYFQLRCLCLCLFKLKSFGQFGPWYDTRTVLHIQDIKKLFVAVLIRSPASLSLLALLLY
jgi:hypothetical protein